MNNGIAFLNSLDIKNVMTYVIAFGAAFVIALWIGLILWVLRDIRSRTRDPFMIILSVLFLIVLFIPGIFVYLFIRPRKTFEQKYQDAIEEEALLREIGVSERCPSCGHNIEKDWILCPYCHTKVKKKCVNCGNALELPWNLCPYCGEQQQKPFIDEKSS
ncbi:MAG: zinc ribbon domain-containing protein [Anaerolineaceae bacterium]|nr:zinc ribbon domain-containing protein [Anaerolineaceae bacterium]